MVEVEYIGSASRGYIRVLTVGRRMGFKISSDAKRYCIVNTAFHLRNESLVTI